MIRPMLLLVAFLTGCATGERNTPDTAGRTAPTPYTAEQIRDATPPGTHLVFRMERAGAPTVLNAMTFVECDAERAVTEGRVTSLGGEPIGQTDRSTGTWAELRDHAAFPAARTRRTRDSVTVPAGTFDAWRYTVRGGADAPETVTHFSFAVDRPGPPVLMVQETAGEITLRMVLIEDSRED